jgi:hypothetical protein
MRFLSLALGSILIGLALVTATSGADVSPRRTVDLDAPGALDDTRYETVLTLTNVRGEIVPLR